MNERMTFGYISLLFVFFQTRRVNSYLSLFKCGLRERCQLATSGVGEVQRVKEIGRIDIFTRN
jgi:hypothetical protein